MPPQMSHLSIKNAGCGLLLALALTGVGSPAEAYFAYVSNEKSNTVTVIDTGKFGGQNHQGGTTAARHCAHQGWQIRAGGGRRRRHHRDDRYRHQPDRWNAAFRPGSELLLKIRLASCSMSPMRTTMR